VHGGQGDESRPIAENFLQVCGELERQARFAHAWWTDQCQQTNIDAKQSFADSPDVLFATDQSRHRRWQAGPRDRLGAARQTQEVRAFARRELKDLGQTRRQLARRSALVGLKLADGVYRTTALVRYLGLAQVEVTPQAPQPLTKRHSAPIPFVVASA